MLDCSLTFSASGVSKEPEPQRDRKAAQGQDEHVHHGAFARGAHVHHHVAQIRQADRFADGRPASENHRRRHSFVHRR